ncbi:MAG: hypothetical protein IT285_15730 [Bdellovibrionales bacterium]|nr:hypothetical protein [Bdellovibrionales bacterium]
MLLLLTHLGVTWMLMGISWVTQLVTYPLFTSVGGAAFQEFHRAYVSRIGPLVGPLMGIELATGAALLMQEPSGLGDTVAASGLGLIAGIWLLTGLGAVPRHRELEEGFNEEAHQSLVRAHALRTLLWTARALLLTAAAAGLIR